MRYIVLSFLRQLRWAFFLMSMVGSVLLLSGFHATAKQQKGVRIITSASVMQQTVKGVRIYRGAGQKNMHKKTIVRTKKRYQQKRYYLGPVRHRIKRAPKRFVRKHRTFQKKRHYVRKLPRRYRYSRPVHVVVPLQLYKVRQHFTTPTISPFPKSVF